MRWAGERGLIVGATLGCKQDWMLGPALTVIFCCWLLTVQDTMLFGAKKAGSDL